MGRGQDAGGIQAKGSGPRQRAPGAARRRLAGAATGLLALTIALAGCRGPEVGLPEVSRSLDRESVRDYRDGPPGAAPGTCWGFDVTPALVETVTEQTLVQPAGHDAEGAQPVPAVYRTESHQRIVRERAEIWFRAPCPATMDREFIESLQRALAARGHYSGPVTGQLDPATRRAVRAFQRPQGLDSSVLSVTAARQLGLVAYDRDDF